MNRLPRVRLSRLAPALLLAMTAQACLADAPPAGAAAAAKPPPCASAQHRAFDFWIGEWDVYAGDTLAGRNSITAIEGGCGLAEHWQGARGGTGVSYNAFDRADGHWHQFWVSNQGYALRLTGGPREGAMVMEGDMPNPKTGLVERQRITWTPNADGSVRQHWETRDATSGTWSTAFDGLYRPRPSPDG